jgi:hypothetical protein
MRVILQQRIKSKHEKSRASKEARLFKLRIKFDQLGTLPSTPLT